MHTDQPIPGILEVFVSDAQTDEKALDDAITRVAEAAVIHGIGVLVTKVSARHYIVRAHPEVPFGLVRRRT